MLTREWQESVKTSIRDGVTSRLVDGELAKPAFLEMLKEVDTRWELSAAFFTMALISLRQEGWEYAETCLNYWGG